MSVSVTTPGEPLFNTQQRKLDETLRLAAKDAGFVHNIQKHLLDGLWCVELPALDQRCLSGSLWRLLGYQPTELSHPDAMWLRIVHTDDLLAVQNSLERLCADAGYQHDQVIRLRHRSGSTVRVRDRGVAIRDANGNAVRVLGSCTDATTVQALAAHHQSHREQWAAADNELMRFFYSASHDLQSPVRSLTGVLHVVASDYADAMDAEGQRFLSKACVAAQRLQVLARGIVDYTRVHIAEGTQCEFDCDVLVRNACASLAEALQDVGAKVDQETLPTIRADPVSIEQLFYALLDNAIKFRSTDSDCALCVMIRAQRHAEAWQFTVEDNGIGIDSMYLETIFSPFKQLHAKSEYKGNGLGLALCQRIVLLHGGRIWAESRVGVGSQFHFTVPADRQ